MSDYKTRMIEEYTQLITRLRKLNSMLEAYYANILDFTPDCPIALLEAQMHTMATYADILELRAEIESVELPSLEELVEV